MLYSQFIYKAENLTIHQLDNEVWYLEPEWKDIICRNVIGNIDDIEDSFLSDWWDVENILRLEVDRRNSQDNKKNEVINWLYEIITSTIEPAILEEENEYIKNVIEYLKTNRETNKQNDIVQDSSKD